MTSLSIEPATLSAPARRRNPTPVRPATGAAWWLLLIMVSTILGFRATIAKGPQGLDLAHAAHGTIALGWSLLLIAQAALADAGRRRAHRLFAIVAVACAVGLVTTSLPMLHTMARAAVANERFRPLGYQLLAMDILLMALFMTLFAVALAFVRKPAVHSRALAATGVLALPAGLGRAYMAWFNVGPIEGSHLAIITGALIIFALVLRDRRARLHEPVYPAVLISLIVLELLFPIIARAGWFDRTMQVFSAA